MEHKLICMMVLLLSVLMTDVHAQQKHSDVIDDYLQYAPYASVLTLKACGVKSRDDWSKLAATTVASWVASAGVGWVLKHSVKETRPDYTDQKSFPSGHTIIAFAGATALHKEFGKVSPWISVAGYSVATYVAVDRVVKKRHYWYDVAAGACIGFAATEVTWWLSDKLFKNKQEKIAIGFSGNTLDVAVKL